MVMGACELEMRKAVATWFGEPSDEHYFTYGRELERWQQESLLTILCDGVKRAADALFALVAAPETIRELASATIPTYGAELWSDVTDTLHFKPSGLPFGLGIFSADEHRAKDISRDVYRSALKQAVTRHAKGVLATSALVELNKGTAPRTTTFASDPANGHPAPHAVSVQGGKAAAAVVGSFIPAIVPAIATAPKGSPAFHGKAAGGGDRQMAEGRSRNGAIETMKALVRKMHAETPRPSALDMCRRLGNAPRPLNAAWRDLEWPKAFTSKHRGAVRKWLSKAAHE